MRHWIILWVVLIGAAAGCDTSSSIEAPDDSFFLKFYGGEGNQEGIDAVLNSDGTITLFGNTDSEKDGQQLYLVNIEQNGRVVWERTFGGLQNERAKDIELTNDGRLVVVADVENTPTERDILIATFTLDGNLMDSTITSFNNSSNQPTDETAISVTQTSDGFIVAGSTSNLDFKPSVSGSNDTRDALHLRYFDNLTLFGSSWRKGHGPGNFDAGTKVVQVAPDQFYFFGYSDAKIGSEPEDFNLYILGLGADGETFGTYNFLTGSLGTAEILTSVVLSPPQSGEGFVLSGVSKGQTNSDIFIVKMRRSLNFGNSSSDFQFQKNIANLGAIGDDKVSSTPSFTSGFLIVSNERVGTVQNSYLTKIGSDGSEVWSNPIIFGGEGDSKIGSVLEMPGGSIGIIGTFSVGQDGEKKMAFIKVNKEGKFLK